VRQAVHEALSRHQKLAELHEEEEETLQYGPFVVDLEKYQVTKNGEVLELTPHEFKLLVHMMQNAHRPISPPELVRVARDYECEDLYEARQIIKWYIHRLRRKVEPDPSNPRFILNVRGVGYLFES
jgi:DNA-binding response OmpR family regulator